MKAGTIIEVSDRARPVGSELGGRYNHEDLVTQSQDGEEGEGKDDTRKVTMGWGTSFREGRFFPPHPHKNQLFHICEGQTEVLRSE